MLFPAHDDAVPAPGVSIKPPQALHRLRSQRIEMDVANQFPKIGIFFTHDGFVSVLKQMAVAFMPDILGDRIAA